MSGKKLCFATNNSGKIQEIKALLPDFTLVSLQEIGCLEELPETHDTMAGNSLEKADYVFKHFAVSCFADDSGLEVEALNGAPGVYSARWAGPGCTSLDNIQLLLKRMEGETNRKAQFKAVITLILDGQVHQFEGTVAGRITESMSGKGGFGYDPVFVPEGSDKTFAEFTMEEKNKISHRGIAVRKLIEFLNSTGSN